MAKAKTKFAREKPKPEREKSLEQRGILLDPANLNVKIKKLEISKEELYEELARDWRMVELAKARVSPKRQIRVLEKTLTSPAFEDALIPLKETDVNEYVYFEALCKVKDTVLYIQEVLYDEMFQDEQARRDAKKEIAD